MTITIGQILGDAVASRAVYFDFETLGGKGVPQPAILGWIWDPDPDDDDIPLEFRQSVVDEALWPAANRTVPLTAGAHQCRAEGLEEALGEIVRLLETQDRYLVSWSTYDRDVIGAWCEDGDLADVLFARFRDGKKTAKRWLADCRPWIEFDDSGWGGRHRLSAYLELVGMPHPKKYGGSVAAAGIRTLKEAFEFCDYYAELTRQERDAWKRVLGHNYWDCLGAYSVIAGAAWELDAHREG